MKRSRKWHKLVWLILPALLFWALRDVPLGEIRTTLSSLGLPQLALLIAFNLFAMLFFSSRWWLILRTQGYRMPYFTLLGYRTAAFAVSYFTPGTQFGGEPFQVYLLENRQHVPNATALAAVTLDKLFELLANFSFLAIGVMLIMQHRLLPAISTPLLGLWAVGLLSLPLIYLLAIWVGKKPFTHASSNMVKHLPAHLIGRSKLHNLPMLSSNAEMQIASLLRSKPQTMLWLSLTSVFIWALSLAEYGISLRLLGGNLSLPQIVIALTAARIAFLTPLPAGLGVLEASQALALQSLGFSPALGIAISLWIRARDVTLGIAGLWLGAFYTQQSSTLLPAQTGD